MRRRGVLVLGAAGVGVLPVPALPATAAPGERAVVSRDDAAPDCNAGRIDRSIRLGNGYMRVNAFGGATSERFQIAENSLHDSDEGGGLRDGGLNNFAEVYVDVGHAQPTNYLCELDLSGGVADPSGQLVTQWWTGSAGGAGSDAGSAPVTVTGGSTASDVDATMEATP